MYDGEWCDGSEVRHMADTRRRKGARSALATVTALCLLSAGALMIIPSRGCAGDVYDRLSGTEVEENASVDANENKRDGRIDSLDDVMDMPTVLRLLT